MSLFCDIELFRILSKSEIFSHSDLHLQGVSYELFATSYWLGHCLPPLLETFIRGSMGMEHADTRSKDLIQGPSSKDMANTTVVSTFWWLCVDESSSSLSPHQVGEQWACDISSSSLSTFP